MYNSFAGELLALCKQGLQWFLITIIFTTDELKEEVGLHLDSGLVRIPGACYGFNLFRGYQAIGEVFPGRCRKVRQDFILGYIKMVLIVAIAIGFMFLMIQHFS